MVDPADPLAARDAMKAYGIRIHEQACALPRLGDPLLSPAWAALWRNVVRSTRWIDREVADSPLGVR